MLGLILINRVGVFYMSVCQCLRNTKNIKTFMIYLKVHSVSNYIIIFVSVCAFIIVVRICVLWPIQDSLVDQPQEHSCQKLKLKKCFLFLYSYHDEVERMDFRINVAFQVSPLLLKYY